MVLKVHPSNFVVSGFTASASLRELSVALAGTGVPLVADLGSGLLRRHPLLPDEPDAASALRDGADLVTGSGDKLLGGPQAGLMLGERELVERWRKHQLAARCAWTSSPWPPSRPRCAGRARPSSR